MAPRDEVHMMPSSLPMTSKLVSTESEEVDWDTANTRTKKHPHAERRTEILKTHPEIAQLFGNNLRSAWYAVALVIAQIVSACFFSVTFPRLYVIIPLAYLLGSLVAHALWVLIHDAGHNLVFKSVWKNRVLLVIANLPHVFPSAMMFRYYHIIHHIELNRVNRDPDVPLFWEAKVVGNSSIMKALWLACFALVQALRMMFYSHRIPQGREVVWIAFNWVAVLTVNVAVTYWVGWRAFVYLTVASLSALGLHPLGARWIQEHYPTHPFQATYSYYGPINRVAFNIGFHNEHHDFPSIPWSKLPSLRKIAPEYYTTLFAYQSYTELLRDFIFEERWSLMVRWEAEMKNE